MNDNILNIIKRALRHVAVLIKSPSLHLYVLAITIVSYMMIYVGNEVYDLLLAKKNHVISAVILVSPFFFFKPKVQKYVWSIIMLIGIWAVMQLMYSRTYHDIMPLSSFFMTENISWLLIDSAIGSFRITDLFVLIPLFLSYVCYRLFILKRLNDLGHFSIRIVSLFFVGFSVVLFLFTIYKDYSNYKEEENLEHDIDLYTEIMVVRVSENTNSRAYSLNGFIPFFIYQTYVYITAGELELNEMQLEHVNDYIKKKSHIEINNAGKDKNLILIIVESFNSWAVNFTIDGKPVTPNISKMVECDSSITALKIVPQVCHGCSSDGHFIYNTGILPIKEGVVCMNYGEVSYPSIAKALSSHSSINVICDEIVCWNQGVTTTR